MCFDLAAQLGTPPRRIPLATRRGTDIPNEVAPEPDAPTRAKHDAFGRRYGRGWEPRKPHVGGYNCAGHVWASRRTSIYEESAVRMILNEDGYRRLVGFGDAAVGDLVIYWHRPRGGTELWLHVAVVCELRPLFSESGNRRPWVLSKFGDTTGEWLHRFDDFPYDQPGMGLDLVIEFYTDRP